jgi:4'-phosphopantetheinyl transferase
LKSKRREEANSRLARTLALPAEIHPLLQSIELPERDVMVWRAHLDSASVSEIDDLRLLLDAAEQERADKFRFERDRTRFVVAHGLLRRILFRALECSNVAFRYGVNGKPALAHDDNLQFNLSHSADSAMFALAWKRQVGIDLESAESLVRNPDDLPGMAERIFSEGEFAAWRSLSANEAKMPAFLRAWTRKEACLKAAGLGLDDMASIEIDFSVAAPLEIKIPLSDNPSRRWTVHDLPVPSPFACAIAIDAGE